MTGKLLGACKARGSLALVGLVVISGFAAAQRPAGRHPVMTLGPTRVGLAHDQRVATELMLTPDQANLVEQTYGWLYADRSNRYQGEQGAAEYAAQLQAMKVQADEKLAGILDDEQKKRLTEIFIQASGADALNDDEIAATLALTEAQRSELSDLHLVWVGAGQAAPTTDRSEGTTEQSNRGRNRSNRSRTRGESSEQGSSKTTDKPANNAPNQSSAATVRKETARKMLAVLTPEQKEQFEKLKGKPFRPGR